MRQLCRRTRLTATARGGSGLEQSDGHLSQSLGNIFVYGEHLEVRSHQVFHETKREIKRSSRIVAKVPENHVVLHELSAASNIAQYVLANILHVGERFDFLLTQLGRS